jgi:hypothetical protein
MEDIDTNDKAKTRFDIWIQSGKRWAKLVERYGSGILLLNFKIQYIWYESSLWSWPRCILTLVFKFRISVFPKGGEGASGGRRSAVMRYVCRHSSTRKISLAMRSSEMYRT